MPTVYRVPMVCQDVADGAWLPKYHPYEAEIYTFCLLILTRRVKIACCGLIFIDYAFKNHNISGKLQEFG